MDGKDILMVNIYCVYIYLVLGMIRGVEKGGREDGVGSVGGVGLG